MLFWPSRDHCWVPLVPLLVSKYQQPDLDDIDNDIDFLRVVEPSL